MYSRPLFLLASLPLMAGALPQLVPDARVAAAGNVESLANTTLKTTSVFLVSYTLYTTVTESGGATLSSADIQSTTDNGGGSTGFETSISSINTNISAQTSTESTTTTADQTFQSVTLINSMSPSPVAESLTSNSPPPTTSNTATITATITDIDTDTDTDTSNTTPTTSPSTLSIPSTDPTTSQPPYTTSSSYSYSYLNTTTTTTPISPSTLTLPLPIPSLNAQCNQTPTAAICLGPPGNRFYCCDGANPRCDPVLRDGGFDCAGKSLGEWAETWTRPTVTLMAQSSSA